MAARVVRKRCPLWLHKASGQWCKKILGKRHYFGTDREKAIDKYERERKDLEAGRQAPPREGEVTVKRIVNEFLTHQRSRVNEGGLSFRSWSEYYGVCDRIISVFGKEQLAVDLGPDDWKRLRAAAQKTLSNRSLAKFITLTKAVFAFAFQDELLDKPARYGRRFDAPTVSDEKKDRTLTAETIWRLLEGADAQMRAMILLGLNVGYGQTDCANLTYKMLAEKPGWLCAKRSKTKAVRKCPLWPETIEAIEDVKATRPRPIDPAHADHVFITAHGNLWCRMLDRGTERQALALDAVALEFKKLKSRMGLSKVPFGPYALRHTHATIGAQIRDREALQITMGHKDRTMTAKYIHDFEEARLQKLSDHIRDWFIKNRPLIGPVKPVEVAEPVILKIAG